MKPVDDQIILDHCADIARRTMAELKSTVLLSVAKLQTADITPRKLNEISSLFERVTAEILDEAIDAVRALVPTDVEWQRDREAYFREIARRE